MKPIGSAAAIAVLASSTATLAQQCPSPRLAMHKLIVKDDGRDRGYPGGLSLADVDGDGDLDLFVTRGYDVTASKYVPDKSLLYLNDGYAHFTRVEEPFASHPGFDSGATFADVDGDGDLDAYVSVELGKPNHFFRNLGHGQFAFEPLGDATADKSGNFSSSFADIDGDGDLDLYVTGPTLEPSAPNLVFRNDGGKFTAVTGALINNGMRNPGASIWADVDGDGDSDLLVANSDITRLSKMPPADVEFSLLYRNDGGGNFAVWLDQPFARPGYSSIQAAFGDVDNDADLDLFVGSYLTETAPRPDWLFLNDGKGQFRLSPQRFPAHAEMSSGAAFADLNGDGKLDLIDASFNGTINLYRGDGAGRFRAVPNPALAAFKSGHSSIVTGDLDGDGRIDAAVGNWSDKPKGEYVSVLMNKTPRCGRWLELALSDRNGAPDPPGARVTLTAVKGASRLVQMREANAQSGLRSQSGSTFLFSLPSGYHALRADIRWPNGETSQVEAPRLGRTKVVAPGA